MCNLFGFLFAWLNGCRVYWNIYIEPQSSGKEGNHAKESRFILLFGIRCLWFWRLKVESRDSPCLGFLMVWNCDASRLGGCRVQMSSSIIGCDGDVKCSHLLQHTAVRVAHTHTQKTSRSMKTTLTLAGRMSSHISLLCFFLYFLVSFHRGIL